MIGLSLKGPTLGDIVYRTIVAVLVLAALLLFVGSLAFGKLGWWRADVWKGRAEEAAQAAAQAQGNADSANAGAGNATTTRQKIDAGTVTLRVETEQSAQRIESYADRPAPVADLEPVDPDVLRELSQAEDRTRAAAARLQRTRPR